jgi:hypothetical protein
VLPNSTVEGATVRVKSALAAGVDDELRPPARWALMTGMEYWPGTLKCRGSDDRLRHDCHSSFTSGLSESQGSNRVVVGRSAHHQAENEKRHFQFLRKFDSAASLPK